MERWHNSSYRTIKEVKLLRDKIDVCFEDGDNIIIDQVSLEPIQFSMIEWENFSFNDYEIVVPAKPTSFIVPWDKLRVLSDIEFAKHLAKESEKQSRLIGNKIKRLRDRKGIKGNELAERSGLTVQTISRIEKGHNDVNFATLRKILASMGYSLKDLANEEAELELKSSPKNFNHLKRRLSYAGIDTTLLTKKIIPLRLKQALHQYKDNPPTLLIDEVISYISTVYDWTPNEIWNSNNLIVKSQPSQLAYFKKPSNANENQVKAYSHYVYYLAKVALKGYTGTNDNYPESMENFRERYLKKYEKLEFESLLDFVWSLGIIVLPLNDTGVFHGASWNIEGKHVIVLKQNTQSHARWIFDLLHELYHVFVHLDEDNTSVIEVEELNPFSNTEATEELEANAFANQFVFEKHAEEFAQESVELAGYKIENLKNAVVKVAKKRKIREDFLSNYLAFRLSKQGENWWSTASKMQIIDPDPFTISSSFFQSKIQMKNLSPLDFNLLNTAISN